MAVVFEEKDSVFFVGGIGTKIGTSYAGGCTQAWYDANFTALTDIMGANGAPLVAESGCDYDHTGGAGGEKEFRQANAGEFAAAEIGMVAYISGTNITTGLYEITGIDSDNGNYVLVSGLVATDDATNAVVRIGGAYKWLQQAIDDIDATHGYNAKIYNNKSEIFGVAGDQIDFDATGGSIANNSQMIVEGFNLLPGDMNYGGTYYQGPLDCLINGVDTNKCVTLNAGGYACDVIRINNFDGLVLKNLYFYNTDKASGHDCISFISNPRNISLINCRFDAAYAAGSGIIYGFEMRGCYAGNDFGRNRQWGAFTAYGGHITNCVFDLDGLTYMGLNTTGVFEHCLFWKGSRGAIVERAETFNNCVFYGQTERCITLFKATDALIQGHNNIFMLAEAADFVVHDLGGAMGSVSDDALRKSCVWTIAGVKVTNHISINGKLRQLSDVIEADPQFVDAANGDFRPRNPAVLRGGKPDISGNPTQMGAILQKYQFGDRERIANMARLRIIR